MACACGEKWLVESCDLATGTIRTVLHPQTFDFETLLNRVGNGSMLLATKEITARDIWPHLTSVYISRVAGGDASFDNPICEYAGIIEKATPSDNNATQVGMKSIEDYLYRRHIKTDTEFVGYLQTDLARDLVNGVLADSTPFAIPLEAFAQPSAYLRDRTYLREDRKNLGEAVEQLTQVINGPDWILSHVREDGRWRTRITFVDEAGADRGQVIRSDVEASDYGLDIDAANHATYVDPVGVEGLEVPPAVDPAGIYPEFDASPSWSDVSEAATLTEHAEGYLEAERDPRATPSVTIPGFDPDPILIRLGDTVQIENDFGALTYRGPARVVGSSWRVTQEAPAFRSLTTLPLTRASQSVLNQQPSGKCADC